MHGGRRCRSYWPGMALSFCCLILSNQHLDPQKVHDVFFSSTVTACNEGTLQYFNAVTQACIFADTFTALRHFLI